MSYDVKLVNENGEILPFSETFKEGGIQCVGGTNFCELNVTYNYGKIYGNLVKDLHQRQAKDTIGSLENFCNRWSDTKPYRDYWAPTPGNAKFAIDRLLSFARENPDGIWEIN